MLPVIPKVRAGDVLRGTKNLRNWLQLASVHTYLNSLLGEYTGARKSRNFIYTPTKNERFVVAVNNLGRFGVWVEGQEIFLLFNNPTLPRDRRITPPSSGAAPPIGWPVARWTKEDQGNVYKARMSPALFARWFISTSEKMPDLEKWPFFAQRAWIALHQDCLSNAPSSSVSYAMGLDYSSPFQIVESLRSSAQKIDLAAYRKSLETALRRRSSPAEASGRTGRGRCIDCAMGPCLEDLPKLRRSITEMVGNPRFKRKLDSQMLPAAWNAIIEHMMSFKVKSP